MSFVGLGAFTVFALKYFGIIDDFFLELLLWFTSSIIYCLTLRFFIIQFYHRKRVCLEVDEDKNILGKIVEVSEDVDEIHGRIIDSDSTWPARSLEGFFKKGEKVQIIKRDNLTWIVGKIKKL